MFDRELKTFAFLHRYAGMLMADVGDDERCARPTPKATHAAWLIGHLATSHDRLGKMFGQPQRLDERWHELFAPGATVEDDASLYPGRDELMAAYDAGHAALPGVIAALPPEKLEEPTPHERLRDALPTTGDLLTFILTGHEATHLGQLSAWRRGLGRDPLF